MFVVSIFVNAFGIAFITKALLGTSPITSVTYVASMFTPLTMGQWTIIVNLLFVALELLFMTRKELKSDLRMYLLQIPISLCFGTFIDVSMNVHAVEVDHRSEKRLIAGFHALYSLGSVAGALAIALLLNAEFSLLYASGVLLILCMFVWTWSVNKLLPDAGKAQGVSKSFALPKGFVLALGLICFLLFMIEGAVLDWGGVFLVEEKSAAIENAGLAFAAFSTAMTLMRLAGDKLIAWAGPRNCVRYGCLLGALMLAGCVFLSNLWIVVALFFVLGVGLANVIPIAFASTADQKVMPMSLALAAVTTLGYAGLLTGPALIGFVAKLTSLSTALLMLAAFLVIVSFSSNIFRKK